MPVQSALQVDYVYKDLARGLLVFTTFTFPSLGLLALFYELPR